MKEERLQNVSEHVWKLFPDMRGVMPHDSGPLNLGDPLADGENEYYVSYQKEYSAPDGRMLKRTVVAVTDADGSVLRVLRAR